MELTTSRALAETRRVDDMETYTARVTRDEDVWMIEVPRVNRSTQAKQMRQVEGMARDLVAIMEGVEPESFALKIEWPPTIAQFLGSYQLLADEAAAAQRRASEAQRLVAAVLKEEGASVRDIGHLMGVSFQRAQQIIETTLDLKREERDVRQQCIPMNRIEFHDYVSEEYSDLWSALHNVLTVSANQAEAIVVWVDGLHNGGTPAELDSLLARSRGAFANQPGVLAHLPE